MPAVRPVARLRWAAILTRTFQHSPNIVHCEWSVTEGVNPAYNCIAWTVGRTDVLMWWQLDTNGNGVVEEGEFDDFYDSYDYTPCALEEAQILLFRNAAGSVTHAAIKRTEACTCGAGRWKMVESKRGTGLKIEHRRDQLNGGLYGDHFRY